MNGDGEWEVGMGFVFGGSGWCDVVWMIGGGREGEERMNMHA
jgi:hypothetical protein